jgi:hypothetical protein
MKGIGSYAGGFPKLLDAMQSASIDEEEYEKAVNGEMGQKHIAYFVGTILAAAAGSYVQLKITCKEVADQDDMMSKDMS